MNTVIKICVPFRKMWIFFKQLSNCRLLNNCPATSSQLSTPTEVFLNLTDGVLTLTEVHPCFFLSCKANARVKLAKTGHGPHSSTLVVICVVLCIICLCVNVYCHRVTTQLQLINIYHIIPYHISYRIVSHIISYHIIYNIISYHLPPQCPWTHPQVMSEKDY
jgi:hypothetical protein